MKDQMKMDLTLLQIENQFLKDELQIQELNHSLELIDTILDGIKKEGKVSPSLEIMFGENVTSKDHFEEEL